MQFGSQRDVNFSTKIEKTSKKVESGHVIHGSHVEKTGSRLITPVASYNYFFSAIAACAAASLAIGTRNGEQDT